MEVAFLVLVRLCLNVARSLPGGCSSLAEPSSLKSGERATILRNPFWFSLRAIMQGEGCPVIQQVSFCGTWCLVPACLRFWQSRVLVPGAGRMRLKGLRQDVILRLTCVLQSCAVCAPDSVLRTGGKPDDLTRNILGETCCFSKCVPTRWLKVVSAEKPSLSVLGEALRQERHAGRSVGKLPVWRENNFVAELGFGLLHTRSWFARPVEDRRSAHRMHGLAREVYRRSDAETVHHLRAQAGGVSQEFRGVWKTWAHDECVCELV